MKPVNSLKMLARLAKATALVAAIGTVGVAHAHRGWMLPSATNLSGNEPWVTVDAAVSNDVFYFEHNAMRLDNLAVWAPDGSTVKAENQATGRYRSTFDVKLAQKGTYKIAMVSDALMASYKVGTETRRARGSLEQLRKDIPANATELNVSQNSSRNEIFVTSGAPSEGVLKPSGKGLELVPVTHPNNLAVGEAATFRFVLDGQPAANVQVLVIPGGNRYREKLDDQRYVTDAQGLVKIEWKTAGMYWLNASPAREGGGPGGPGAGGPGAGGAPAARPAGPVGTLDKPVRRASYVTVLEVMPQ